MLAASFVAVAGGCEPPSTVLPGGTGGVSSGTGAAAGGAGGAGGVQPAGGSGGGQGGGGGGGQGSGGSAGSETGGASGSGGAAGAVSDAGAVDVSSGADGAGSGFGGIPGIENFAAVKPTAGCGTTPGQALGSWVMATVTMTPKPVRGSGTREYYIKLPTNYDNKKPYHLIFVAPGCSGKGNAMFDFTAAAGTEGVIQIGLNPEPGVWMGSCFDDKRTDSIEYQFVETVLDLASKKLCFDQHRVFFTGHSSGSWLSNQMGCVYGSKLIRAIAPSSGGLAQGAGVAPPCTDLPTPGIWSHNENDNPIGSQNAITRALKVNGCQGTFADSPRAPWGGEAVCQQFATCPAEFPVVYCHPPTGGHLGNLTQQPARSWKFWKSLP